MRVVLDVNLLVSAGLTPGGEAHAILDLADAGYDLLLSGFILQQVEKVLNYPRVRSSFPHVTQDVISRHLAELKATGIFVNEETAVSVSFDPEDNRILAAAVDGKADYIVTRNVSHFPTVYGRVKVLSPAEFLKFVRQREPEP